MKFGSKPVPERLFTLARERLLNNATSTPEDVRRHLLKHGQAELLATNSIEHNHRIIAQRVFDAVRLELVHSGALVQFKRGLWATSKFMQSADDSDAEHAAKTAT